VTAGSRGIRDIAAALRAAVAWLREQGAEPFLVPAMGSHGGATAAGQITMLAELGVTEQSVGCTILSSMEVVELGRLDDGTPVYMDRNAATADGVLVVNRIKPHTDFHAEIESGLGKMCAVGLGKRRGAETVHNRGANGLRTRLPHMARLSVERGKVLGGIALIENAAEHTAEVHFLAPHEIAGAREAALLAHAKTMIGRLPFDQLDVLVIDEIGKNISGCGIDTNVVGRMRMPGQADPPAPRITAIVALDITEASHGNAAGVGVADLIAARLARKIDFAATYINGITSGTGGLMRMSLPMILPTARDAVATALRMVGVPELDHIRLARIPNTLHLGEIFVSAPLLDEVRANDALELLGEAPWENVEE
ncbi:MAG: DUF2088 domain-containing protein, partial [Chloroflexales bacterium]|nr:DUF2088 domain-containing protein [Chloroflexales bacterium]